MKKLFAVVPILAILSVFACRSTTCPPCPSPAAPPQQALADLNFVDVTIVGLNCFYLPKDANGNYVKPMLLVLKDPDHKPTISLSETDSTQLYNAIVKKDCTSSSCEMGNY